MDSDEKDKQIQKKIDWIASQIRETKFELHRQHQELDNALKEQEELRKQKGKKVFTENGRIYVDKLFDAVAKNDLKKISELIKDCLLYTSDAADE